MASGERARPVTRVTLPAPDCHPIDLTAFAGHPWESLSCPSEPSETENTLNGLCSAAEHFAFLDAWVLAVADHDLPSACPSGWQLVLRDTDDRLYREMSGFIPGHGYEPQRVATFLVGRRGNLQKSWPGCA